MPYPTVTMKSFTTQDPSQLKSMPGTPTIMVNRVEDKVVISMPPYGKVVMDKDAAMKFGNMVIKCAEETDVVAEYKTET